MWDFITDIVPSGLAYTAPLLIIALGGLYSERSGVVNIGLEGLLGIGAFFSSYFVYLNYGEMGKTALWLGLLIGGLSGAAFAALHAFASVSMKANQVISGTAINMLSAALTIFLARRLTGSANVQIELGFTKTDVELFGVIPLYKIPIIGPLLFTDARVTTYIVIAILLLSWYLLYKTPFGLRFRACGENPHAADSMGVNVGFMRYFGVIMSGFMAGLGGAIVILTYSGEFSQNIYNGLGFLALAALIFGKWNPWGILGASLFFGLAKTVSNLAVIYESLKDVPNIFLNTFPYVVTIIALILFAKNSSAPRASGEPYDVGKR